MKNLFKMLLILSVGFFAACENNTQQKQDYEKIDNSLTQEEIDGGILTPEILWKFNRIGGSQLSPDGENVVFTITNILLIKIPEEPIFTVFLQKEESLCSLQREKNHVIIRNG